MDSTCRDYRILGTHVKIRHFGGGMGWGDGFSVPRAAFRLHCFARQVHARCRALLPPRTAAVPLAGLKLDNVQNWLVGVKMGILDEEDALRAVPGSRGSCSGDC